MPHTPTCVHTDRDTGRPVAGFIFISLSAVTWLWGWEGRYPCLEVRSWEGSTDVPFDCRVCSHTPSSDLYQDERAAEQRCKKMAVSSLPLCSLWLVFQNSQMLAREGWSEGDMRLSCVIFALLWKSMFQMSDLSVSLLCNFLPVCLSFLLFTSFTCVLSCALHPFASLTISYPVLSSL